MHINCDIIWPTGMGPGNFLLKLFYPNLFFLALRGQSGPVQKFLPVQAAAGPVPAREKRLQKMFEQLVLVLVHLRLGKSMKRKYVITELPGCRAPHGTRALAHMYTYSESHVVELK